MASIEERINSRGVKTYRVRFRRNGFKSFIITFPSRYDAEEWVLLNEEKYYEDPDKYKNWFKDVLKISWSVKKREMNER